MRRTRRIFLLVLICLVAGVATSYYRQKAQLAATAPVAPAPLDSRTRVFNSDWVYYKGERDCPELELRAREAEGVEQPKAKMLLRGMQMRIYHKCGKSFDLVKSDSAEFDEAEGRMFADGEVDITLSMPSDETQKSRLVRVVSSGIEVDMKSVQAKTSRHARFEFEMGSGEAVGAEYDPKSRELVMLSAVKLDWRGKGGGPPMKIQAGRLLHKEDESKVYLSAPARMVRDTLTLEGGDAVVTLEHGAIRLVESQKASGIDTQPRRQLQFGANQLRMELSERSEIEKILGTGDARLTATTATGTTDIATERIDLAFQVVDKASLLQTAHAYGKTRLESKPVARPGAIQPHTRVLLAGGVLTKMRAGGEEVESVETTTPGEVDLLPNHPSQARRWMQAERIWIDYGEHNQLDSLRAVQVATRTIKPKRDSRASPPPPSLTWSNGLNAKFDPGTGEMTRMEQWENFRFQEGDRQATAARAILEAQKDLITLDQAARAWDPTGSVSANQIVMNEKTGDYTATGEVNSSRLPGQRPDQKQPTGSTMLARDQPTQAKAARMVSTNRNRHIVYDGNAVLWQATNRLQADRVVIDRVGQTLDANGKVTSQFLDRKTGARTKRQTFTVVRSETLRYTDHDRLAYYHGGVRLIRDGMDVKSRELRAWLNEDKPDAASGDKAGDSSLHHAFADGAVEILQQEPGRTRKGSSEHAEYHVAEEKVILNGGSPLLVDSVKGITRGRQLTYFAGNDSFQVEGALTQPVVSKIRRN